MLSNGCNIKNNFSCFIEPIEIIRCITLQEAQAKLQAAEDSFEQLEQLRR